MYRFLSCCQVKTWGKRGYNLVTISQCEGAVHGSREGTEVGVAPSCAAGPWGDAHISGNQEVESRQESGLDSKPLPLLPRWLTSSCETSLLRGSIASPNCHQLRTKYTWVFGVLQVFIYLFTYLGGVCVCRLRGKVKVQLSGVGSFPASMWDPDGRVIRPRCKSLYPLSLLSPVWDISTFRP